MCSLSGLDYDYYKKNITGIYEITDGGGSSMVNGVINCNELYIDGVAITQGTIMESMDLLDHRGQYK